MNPAKRKSRENARQRPALGLVIGLSTAAGIVIGSAGTHYLSKPALAPTQPAASAVGGMPPVALTPPMGTASPQNRYIPGPQPPGEVPPGKIWSYEHGHWHDAPPASVTPAPEASPTSPPAAAVPPPPTLLTPPPTAPGKQSQSEAGAGKPRSLSNAAEYV